MLRFGWYVSVLMRFGVACRTSDIEMRVVMMHTSVVLLAIYTGCRCIVIFSNTLEVTLTYSQRRSCGNPVAWAVIILAMYHHPYKGETVSQKEGI